MNLKHLSCRTFLKTAGVAAVALPTVHRAQPTTRIAQLPESTMEIEIIRHGSQS